ncbi:MAG: 30S ribosome-binding factor RbfA [Rickettsiaceae bacterium]
MNNSISYRKDRIERLVHKLISELFTNYMFDHALSTLTITKVKITSDLKIAHCYFIPSKRSIVSKEFLLNILNKAKGEVRQYVNKYVKLKYSPQIKFHYDDGIDNANHIEQLLRQINYTTI